MKKSVTIWAIGVLIALSLSGCSQSVKKADYDAVVTERDSLKDKNKDLENKTKDLENKNKELEDKKANLVNELLKQQQKQANQQYSHAPALAWARASYGDGGTYLVDNDDYMVCIAPGTYEASYASIKPAFDSYKLSVALLQSISKDILYKKISTKYLAADGSTLLEISVKRDGDSYVLNGISGDLTKSTALSQAIMQISN